MSIPKVKIAVLKNLLIFGEKYLPQSVRLLEGGGVESLFGRIPFEHASSLCGASLTVQSKACKRRQNRSLQLVIHRMHRRTNALLVTSNGLTSSCGSSLLLKLLTVWCVDCLTFYDFPTLPEFQALVSNKMFPTSITLQTKHSSFCRHLHILLT